MDYSQKEQIIRDYLSTQALDIDLGIKEVVVALSLHGFHTIQSCEGHLEFPDLRFCYPYVSLTNRRLRIGEDKRVVIDPETESWDQWVRLERVVTEFDRSRHSHQRPHLPLELQIVMGGVCGNVGSLPRLASAQRAKVATICNVSWLWFKTAPWSLITPELRRESLQQTQDEMNRFCRFLQDYSWPED